MRFFQEQKLNFSDVLICPRSSSIGSREQVDLFRRFEFLHANHIWFGIPIISANMRSVTTSVVAEIMASRGMLAGLPHKTEFIGIHDYNYVKTIRMGDPISDLNCHSLFVCLDVANGYMHRFIDKVQALRNIYGSEKVIIAGNVVTPEAVESLVKAGADIVKVGIGSGAACSTRVKTGVGYPQLSAVIECADAAHGLGAHIISDGGCVIPGDVAKAFAAGADFVMLGGMLAGHNENGPDFYGEASSRAKAPQKYHTQEGWEIRISPRGPLADTITDIFGGLRSACSYVGARNLQELHEQAVFVRSSEQHNRSLLSGSE